MLPSPYSLVLSDQKWDGIDGNWTSFRISIGTPPQNFRVLISTRGSTPLVPTPESCKGQSTKCLALLGVQPSINVSSQGFQHGESTTWQDFGTSDIVLEDDLGYKGRGPFGTDTVHLSYDGESSALSLNTTYVAGIDGGDFYMGSLGISDTQLRPEGNSVMDSFVTSLMRDNKIPSSSYGYTAGARYRDEGVPGSLVLGGYDQSRSGPTKFNFTFSQSTGDPLRVEIKSITANVSRGSQSEFNLIPSGKVGPSVRIDSTVPHLWLPEYICAKFEEAFGLTYNETHRTYYVNETLHEALQHLNPSLTFELGNDNARTVGSSLITLPYAAFDLWKTSVANGSVPFRYFPLKRTDEAEQYTIGHVFLREAYLAVDHERKIFSLAQAKFPEEMPQADIRAIYSPGTVFPSKGLSMGAKAGIAIAAVLIFLLVVAAALFRCWWKPRRKQKGRSRGASIATSTAPTYQEKYDQQPPGYTAWADGSNIGNGIHNRNKSGNTWIEMPAEQVERRPELEGTQSLSYELADNHEPAPVHEMEASVTGESTHVASASVGDVDGDGNAPSQKIGNKKRGRRASMVPFPSVD